MKKVPTKYYLDKLHRGVVYSCIGVSITGLVYVGLVGWNYYMNVKPQLIAEQLRKQQELLQEGTGFIENQEFKS